MDKIKISDDIYLKGPLDINAEELYTLIDDSREHLQNLVWVQSATLASTIEFLKMKSISKDKLKGIYYKGHIAGNIEFRDKGSNIELGYWLGYEFRGKGIMKTVVKQTADDLAKTHSISAKVKLLNKTSFAILNNAELHEVSRDEEWIYLLRPKNAS